MRSTRPPRILPVLAALALSLFLGSVGCSGGSGKSGSQVSILESDEAARKKSADARLKQAQDAKAARASGSKAAVRD